MSRITKGTLAQLLEKWEEVAERWERGEEEKETGWRRLDPSGLGPGIPGRAVSPRAGHTPTPVSYTCVGG